MLRLIRRRMVWSGKAVTMARGDVGFDAQADEPGALALAICGSVIWFGHLIERYANLRLPGPGVPPGMSLPRARLLLVVEEAERAGAVRMNDVALELGVTARTITTMVDALEDQGLIVRTADPNDRRAIILRMTPDGAAAMNAIKQALAEISATLVSPLSAAEQRQLLALLTRLIEREEAAS